MNWIRDLSIHYKVNGVLISLLLLLSLVIGALVYHNTTNLLNQQTEKRGAEIGYSLAALSSDDILLDNRYALFERISKTKDTTEGIRYILMTDFAGNILAHTFSGQIPKGLFPANILSSSLNQPAGYHVTRFDSNEGEILDVLVPIENGAIGYVQVGMSTKFIHQLINKAFWEFALAIFLVCLLAAFLATRLANYLIQPLLKLTSAARQIRRGNYPILPNAHGNDEVGNLASVFNEMACSLNAKERENTKLVNALREKEALRTVLLTKLFTVQEEERKRISRELHDETGQSMVSLIAYMKLLSSSTNDPKQKELLLHARDVTAKALSGLRNIAVELRPPVLDDLGITAAMEKYINNFREQTNLAVTFIQPEDRLMISSQSALALYRILQESLTNILKHAKATQVDIALIKTEQSLTLTICDNGQGIKQADLKKFQQKNHLGLYGMRERAELLGGSFTITSSTCGSIIQVVLPLE